MGTNIITLEQQGQTYRAIFSEQQKPDGYYIAVFYRGSLVSMSRLPEHLTARDLAMLDFSHYIDDNIYNTSYFCNS